MYRYPLPILYGLRPILSFVSLYTNTMGKTPKIVLLDVETMPLVAATFSLYPESINHESILSDESIICICWKILEQKAIYSTSILDDLKTFKEDATNDFVVIHKIREVLQDADIVIGHNLKKFDWRKINSRLIYHGLDPLPSGIHLVDTLTMARKIAAFPSNRLDYLAKLLTGTGKTETSRGLWLRVLKGEKKAVKEMTEYCKNDVQILEDVYLKLRPYMPSHPHVGAMDGNDKNYTCPKCGGEHFINKAIRYTAAGVKKVQKQCKGCFGYTNFIYKEE